MRYMKKIQLKKEKDDLVERREKRAENRRKERVYLDEDEDFEIDFSSNKTKKSFDEDEFSSQRSTRRRDEKEEKFEAYEEVNLDDFEVDNYDDFEDYEDDYEEDFKQEKKSKKENGFISKLKGLFSSNKKEDEEFLDDEYLDEEDEDDEAEDYKTYLERQKREQKEKSKIVEKI